MQYETIQEFVKGFYELKAIWVQHASASKAVSTLDNQSNNKASLNTIKEKHKHETLPKI